MQEMETRPSGYTEEASKAVVRWQAHLEGESELLLRTLRSEVGKLLKDEAKSKKTCMRCNAPKCILDLVVLNCHPERRPQNCAYQGRAPPHIICFACVSQIVKKQEIFLRVMAKHDSDQNLSWSTWLAEHPVKVIPCPLCKSPCVLSLKTMFSEGLDRNRIEQHGTVTRFQFHATATKVMSDNYITEEVFENQRRPLFGVFSHDNMLSVDWRGQFSNFGGSELEYDPDQLWKKTPNKSWVWLEVHSPDTTLPNSGTNGWQYSNYSWPRSNEEYHRDISIFHFVRRRRLLHTRIRVNEAVQEQMEALRKEVLRLDSNAPMR